MIVKNLWKIKRIKIKNKRKTKDHIQDQVHHKVLKKNVDLLQEIVIEVIEKKRKYKNKEKNRKKIRKIKNRKRIRKIKKIKRKTDIILILIDLYFTN